MHSGDAKITYLVREHLQTKEKNQNGRGRVRVWSRKGKGEEEGADLIWSRLCISKALSDTQFIENLDEANIKSSYFYYFCAIIQTFSFFFFYF